MDNDFIKGLKIVEDVLREIEEELGSPDLTDERRASLHSLRAEIITNLDRIRKSLP
jgi:hypothetical protein